MKVHKLAVTHVLLGTALLGSGIFSSSVAMASDNCTKFSLTSNVIMLSPTGPAMGFAEAVMEDGTVLQISAQGEITSTKFGDDGTIHMTVREVDDWGPLGTTIGMDKLNLSPTAIPGEYTLNIKTHIIGDTGVLGEVFGKYHGHGIVSFSNGSLTHSGAGKVCNLPF